MATKNTYHPIVKNLVQLIQTNNWEQHFERAIKKANVKNVPLLENVKNLEEYLDWIDAFL